MPMPWERKKPWPYEMVIERAGFDPVGVRLRPGENGQLVGQRSRRVDAVSPSTYDQGSLNPYIERPFVMGRLDGGMGEAVQRSNTTNRYKAAFGVDCSIGGLRRLGPEFTAPAVPALATSPKTVRQVLAGPAAGGTTDQLYALRGRNVDALIAGTWTLSKDFGATNQPTAAVVFQGTTGTKGIFVSTENGQLWEFDGTTWTVAVLPAGASAYAVERVGDELYIGGANAVHVATADPLLAASWGGAILVGDESGRITYLKSINNVLFVFKTDGVYTLNSDGSVNDLTPEFRPQAAATNGVNAVPFRDRLWFAYADSYYQIDSDGGYAAAGPELLTENDSSVNGSPVSGAAHAGWFLYLLVYNARHNVTHLLKYGTWTPGADTSAASFAPVWHGAIKSWSGKQGTRCDVTYLGTNPTLWVGFSDGTLEQAVLPVRTPDPAEDTACRFQTTGTLYWPIHHGMAQEDDKHWRRFGASGPHLDADDYVTVAWEVDASGLITVEPTHLDASGESFVPEDAMVGKIIEVQERLTGTATSTPIVESVVLYEQVRAARLELEYRCVAIASNHGARLDGVVERRSADQILTALKSTAGPGPTTVWLIDGRHLDVDFVEYGEAVPNPDARYGVEWDVPLALVEWRDTPA